MKEKHTSVPGACFIPCSLYRNVFSLDFTSSAGAVIVKIQPFLFTGTLLPLPLWAGFHVRDRTTCILYVCVCVCEELRYEEVIQASVSSQ